MDYENDILSQVKNLGYPIFVEKSRNIQNQLNLSLDSYHEILSKFSSQFPTETLDAVAEINIMIKSIHQCYINGNYLESYIKVDELLRKYNNHFNIIPIGVIIFIIVDIINVFIERDRQNHISAFNLMNYPIFLILIGIKWQVIDLVLREPRVYIWEAQAIYAG